MVQKVSIDFCRKVVKKRFYNKIPVTVTVSEYQEGFDAKWPHFSLRCQISPTDAMDNFWPQKTSGPDPL